MSKRSVSMSAAGASVVSKDPNFKNVSLLLQGDVSNPDLTYNAFSDASSNNFAITPNGDAYGSSFSPYNTTWSNYFDGSGDSLDVANNEALNMSSGNFTIEFWVNMSTLPGTYARILQICHTNVTTTTDEGICFEISPSNQLGFSCRVGSTDSGVTDPNALVTNTWIHFAAVRNGSTLTFYKNGVSLGTSSISGAVNFSSSFVLALSRWRPGTRHINGYLSNVRVVKGTAVYTSNFTPSTTPLTAISGTSLLTCQSNRFIDNSSNNFAITRNGDVAIKSFSPFTDTDTTTGSGYFDGTGDWLYVPNSSQLAMAGDFTIEFWVYPLAASGIYSKRANSSVYPPIYIVVSANQRISFSGSTTGSSWTINPTYSEGSLSVPFRAWNHIAVVRNGTTFTAYINGVADPGATFTGISGALTTNTSQAVLGAIAVDGSNPCNGYIQNFRITNAAVYTGNFTPPTGPLATSGAASAASYPSTTNVNTTFASSATSLLTLQTRGATQNIGFVDSSPNKFPITKVGNTTQGTFSPYGNLWSNYFVGTSAGNYLSGTGPSLASGDWTIECWVNLSTLPSAWSGYYNAVLFSNIGSLGSRNGLQLQIVGSGATAIGLEQNSGYNEFTLTSALTVGTWYHIAITRTSGNLRCFVNGVQQGSTVSAGTTGNNFAFYIGQSTYGSSYAYALNGYISNFRIVGSSLYTSNFTPSTTPLTAVSGTSLLTCQSNRFIDNSSNNFTITRNGDVIPTKFSPFNPTAAYSSSTIGGSVCTFSNTGSSDTNYTATPSNPIFAFGTNDFTVECWAYITSRPRASEGGIVSSMDRSANVGVSLTARGAGIGNGSTGTSIVYDNAGWCPLNNTWYHLAVTRQGSTARAFCNGILVGTITNTSNINTTVFRTFLTYSNGEYGGNGYVSGFRVLNGTALYTSSFTPPTTPPTPIANTQLLMNFTNAGIPDLSMQNNLETVGNAQVSTSVKKYGTGSLAFDGTGDYLLMPPSPNFTFGTGDFTIEGWVYLNQTKDAGVFNQGTSVSPSSTVNSVAFGTSVSGVWQIYAKDTYNLSSATFALSTWYHFAVVRSSGTTKLYINGTAVITVSADTTNYTGTYFGVGYLYSTDYTLNGYIDDLRITKGYARYTANFTPPTQSLPKQ